MSDEYNQQNTPLEAQSSETISGAVPDPPPEIVSEDCTCIVLLSLNSSDIFFLYYVFFYHLIYFFANFVSPSSKIFCFAINSENVSCS